MYCMEQFKNTIVYYSVRIFTVIVMKLRQRILYPIRFTVSLSPILFMIWSSNKARIYFPLVLF